MKIVHLNTERTWRGGERQTLWLARALQARGHANWVAARPGAPLAQAAARAGVPVFPLRPYFEFDLFAAGRLRRFLRETGAEILHAHTGHAVGVGALAAVGTAVHTVATRRVDFPLRRNFPTWWKYARQDAVAVISTAVGRLVAAAGVPAEKIVLIPSGVDPTGYPSPADRGRLRRDRGLPPDAPVVVHAAALTPHKDQATLLHAFADVRRALPAARLLILGEGRLRRRLERLARGLGVSDAVAFLGQRPDVLDYTALADLFVLSSQEEGLGTALLDALVLGVPTAATTAGGIPDIYGPGAPELSPVNDPRALAENMLRALRDPAEAARRVARGREILPRFTVAAMADAYEKLYRSLTGVPCPV